MSHHQPKTVILDTNIWISSLLENDANHFVAKRNIARYFTTGFTIILLPPVIVEIINILTRHGWSKHQVKKEIQTLTFTRNIRIVNIENSLLFEGAINLRIEQNIRSQDFLILVYCQLLKPQKFVTFDQKLLRIYQQINSNKP
jgi:predicted nucleic acid-binding protein